MTSSPEGGDDALLAALGPVIARWLTPYVVAELDARERPQGTPGYDDRTCARYVAGMGDPVLARAFEFFTALADEQGLESRELAPLLKADTPRAISSLLTNSLKKRAKALRLPLPWSELRTHERRTAWRDRDGIASRMTRALAAELENRSVGRKLPRTRPRGAQGPIAPAKRPSKTQSGEWLVEPLN